MQQKISKAITLVNWYLNIVLIVGLMIAPYQPIYTYAQAIDDTQAIETLPETAGEEAQGEDPVTLIETGAADSVTETYNFSNTNEIEASSSSESAASSTPDEITEPIEETDIPVTEPVSNTDETLNDSISNEDSPALETASTTIATTTPPATVIEIENQATSTTAATTSATTGDNIATSSNGTAIVNSGDAYAYTNVVNLTNTNIINSDGFIVFLNQLFGTSNIDFRDMFDVFSDTGTTSNMCATDDCQADGLETYISNQTTVSNDITVVADTGNNEAAGGTAAVLTGDAYAAANVTNVANTNIIDANYLVMTFSNFGDLFGDVILPGAHLLETLFQSSPSVQTDAAITNDATIENQVSATANTGDNSSTGSSSLVTTGDATTYTNVYNQANTNLVTSDSFTLLFRIHGDWAGEVFGLPEGLSYQQTPDGITISNATSQSTPATANNISATITNDATITNNVSVEANTGNNQAHGDELGYVSSGDAYAAANVTNVANTNILGRNWSLLIFDIFGDWQGDISFGQPDIWIGGTANALNGTTAAGSEILYTFTISNLGDATATNVILNGDLSSDLITFEEPMEDIQIGSIAPGETIEKTFVADVTSTLPSGSFPVDLEATLTSNTPDADLDNNREVVTVIAENKTHSGGGRSSINSNVPTKDADMLITKTANIDAVEPGGTVSYEVTLTNSGGPVYDAILYDTLYDSTGAVMLDQNWPLYTIDSDETVTINYDVAFATSTEEGTYFNRAQLLGYHQNTNPKYMKPYDSMVATVPINIGEPSPIVLGLTTTECTPYLTSFLKYNQANDIENVRRLQTFLNEQGSLTIPATGHFDSNTAVAVEIFQQKHRDSILEPWGLTKPTGHVYYTTQKTINEIKCAHEKTFPLSVAQASEIERYKNYRPPVISTTATIPRVPNIQPAVVSEVVLPEVEVEVVTPISTIPNPLIPDETFGISFTQTRQTASSVSKTLTHLIQTGARAFTQLKFW